MQFSLGLPLPTPSYIIIQAVSASRQRDEPYPVEQPKRTSHVPPRPTPLAQTLTADQPQHNEADHIAQPYIAYPRPDGFFSLESPKITADPLVTRYPHTGLVLQGTWSSLSYDSPSDQLSLDHVTFVTELYRRLEEVQRDDEEPKFCNRLKLLAAGGLDESRKRQSPPFVVSFLSIPPRDWNDGELLLVSELRSPFNTKTAINLADLWRMEPGPEMETNVDEFMRGYGSTLKAQDDGDRASPKYASSSSSATSGIIPMILDTEDVIEKAESQLIEMDIYLAEAEAQVKWLRSENAARRKALNKGKEPYEEEIIIGCKARDMNPLLDIPVDEVLKGAEHLEKSITSDLQEIAGNDTGPVKSLDDEAGQHSYKNMFANAEESIDAIDSALQSTDTNGARVSIFLQRPSEDTVEEATRMAKISAVETSDKQCLHSPEQAAAMPRRGDRVTRKPRGRAPIPTVGEAVLNGEFPILKLRRSRPSLLPKQEPTILLDPILPRHEEPAADKFSRWNRYCCFPKIPLEDMAPWTRLGWSQHACLICHTAYHAEDEVIVLPCEHIFHEDCVLPKSSAFLKTEAQSSLHSLKQSNSHIFQRESSDRPLDTPSINLKAPFAMDPRPIASQGARLVDRRMSTCCCLCQLPACSIASKSAMWKNLSDDIVGKAKMEETGRPTSKMINIIEKIREYHDRRRNSKSDGDGKKVIGTFHKSKDNLVFQEKNKIYGAMTANNSHAHLIDSLTIEDFAPADDMMDWINRHYEFVEGRYRWSGRYGPIQAHTWNGKTIGSLRS